MSTDAMPLCLACRHFLGAPYGVPACRAFPDGIPRWVLEGRANHRYPYPGDGGVRFEPADDATDEVLAELEERFP